MRRLTFYDNMKTYFYPDGSEAPPDRVLGMYPMVGIPEVKVVIETDVTGTIFYTQPKPLLTLADEYDLNPEKFVTDNDLLKAIEDILNAPQPEHEPSAEERIASALEFQNLMSL